MLELRSIGILLRDSTQQYPLDFLRSVFEPRGVRMFMLNDGLPEMQLDLVIAMGGDGTVLRALDLLPDCPVLAINYGTVGFLTAGDRDDLPKLVDRLLSGDYKVSERLLLRCDVEGRTVHAVNEVFLKSSARMIRVDVFVNDARIRTIRGDGVIVGTPTGSTGYLLSTGAPVVMPDADCFVLDGINEYNFTSRALILPSSARIRLHVEELQEGQTVQLAVDGNTVADLQGGQELIVSRSERRGQLIFFDEHYFFHNLTSRLSWN